MPEISEDSTGHPERTPSGGVRSEIFYSDDEGRACEAAVATRAEITEFDAAGNVLRRTYMVRET